MMASLYYYEQNPSGFCFLVQIRAFVTQTSLGLQNLNMKGKTKIFLVVVVEWSHRPWKNGRDFKISLFPVLVVLFTIYDTWPSQKGYVAASPGARWFEIGLISVSIFSFGLDHDKSVLEISVIKYTSHKASQSNIPLFSLEMNVLWAIIWLLVLWFLAWPVGFFCAGWYVCLSPFEACVDAMKGLTELLMRGVKLPLEVAQHMVEGKQGW